MPMPINPLLPNNSTEGNAESRHPVSAAQLMLAAYLLLTFFHASLLNAQQAVTAPDSVKWLLIEFFSYNSMESKMVNDQIIKSGPAAEIINDHCRLISLEQGRDVEREKRYNISRFPTLIIAQLDGTELDRVVGFRKPMDVATILKAAIEGKSEIVRLQEKAATPGPGIHVRLALAAALRQRNDLAGAFQEYQWILDNGALADPATYKATFRTVTRQLATFGKDYPAALDDLSKRRDYAESAFNSNASAVGMLERAFILNETLNQASRNVPLYLEIPATSPLKQSLFPNIFPLLVQARKYKEAADVADLENFVGALYPRFHYEAGHHAHDGHNHAQNGRVLRERIVKWTTAACEALVALGELEKAKRVAGRGLDYMGEDKEALLSQLATITVRTDKNARAFDAWLKTYLETKPTCTL